MKKQPVQSVVKPTKNVKIFGISESMKAKKSLGQNFFVNKSLGDKIITILSKETPLTVIEIGPGTGFFTERLIPKSKVVAIEKDQELAQVLAFNHPDLTIFTLDFLDFNFTELTDQKKPIIFFGALPYNVSKKIIGKCISWPEFTSGYFIIQKEVAEKYTSKNGKTSLLSITAEIYATATIKLNIEPGSFRPVPKVKSTFIKFDKNGNINRIPDLGLFLEVVRQAFSMPRKMLSNNLKKYVKLGFQHPFLLQRAENLDFSAYLELTQDIGAIMNRSEKTEKKEKGKI